MKRATAIGLLILSIAAGLLGYFHIFVRTGLPLDGEMIDQYSRHRKEFEDVARRYRDFEASPGVSRHLWASQPGAVELLATTKIDRIQADIHTPFIPKAVLEEHGWSRVEDYSKSPNPFKYIDKYGTLIVNPSPQERYIKNNIVHSSVWKGYTNFPSEPHVDEGYIFWENGSARIVDSLDRFPSDWKTGECVYRKLDPTWYMHLCNGH